MAIRRKIGPAINAVEVISKNDESLDLPNCDFEGYQASGDTSFLKFLPDMQPTTFLCNFQLQGKDAAKIKNSMIGGIGDDGEARVAIGTWQFQVAKLVLKGINNPASVPADESFVFKTDKDGKAHDDLIAELDQYGVVGDIFTMFNKLTTGGTKANAKN